ncbi:hypothetical protein P691DRAFT_159438 [Macrolepiota fuliginosa MF-IS2]|uniref:J domain-containing protein n=1 Tax=Macrolepiota fuliginosa MF-IS2 TaxID=1400762 RepID=A0A9P5XAQ3_9AGAR|nr:hypothetical protein P691DRAFT_159438 [Macrolepiota fuliginosa MF-IS2]
MSPYDVLDISSKATDKEIRAAYRAMAKKWHPDRMLNDQETATKKFMEISSAYRAILRERRREARERSPASDSSTSSSDKRSNSASSNARSPDESRRSFRSRTKENEDEKGTRKSPRSSGRDDNGDHSHSSNRRKGERRSSSEKLDPDARHKGSSASRSSSSSSPQKSSSSSSSSPSSQKSSSSSSSSSSSTKKSSSSTSSSSPHKSSSSSSSSSPHKTSPSSSSPQRSSSSSSSSSSSRSSPPPHRSSPSSSASSSPQTSPSSSSSSSSSRESSSSSSSSSSPPKSSSSSASPPPSRPSSSSSSRSSASSSSSAFDSDSDEGLSSASSRTSVNSASTDSLLDSEQKHPKVNDSKCPIPNGSMPSFTSYTSSEASAYDNPEITPPPDQDSLHKEARPRGENPNPKPSGNDSTAGVTTTPSPPARPPDGHRSKLSRPHRDKPKDSTTKMRKPAGEDRDEGRTLIPEYDSPLACAVGVSKEWTYTVRLTLEELFYGKKLRFRVLRCKLDGKRKTVILDVDVPPGSSHGTQMVFKGAGHERKDGTRQDIVFIIEEVKHERFVRLKEDLALDVRLPWVESLKKEAAVVYARRIDGEQSEFEVDFRKDGEVTGTAVFPGAGMPIPGTEKRGKLIVRWEIYMPSAPSRWEAFKQALHL